MPELLFLFEDITNTNHSSLVLKSKKDFISNSYVRELDGLSRKQIAGLFAVVTQRS